MNNWTLESYNKLCEEHATGASWEVISQRLKCSKQACRSKYNRGINKSYIGKTNIWTNEEIELLRWCCTCCKNKKIKWDIVAKTVNRTVNACKKKWQSIKNL